VVLDDEYTQRIEIKSVSSHTVWESASGILPAVKTRAVREKVAPFATSRSRHATCCDGPQTVSLEIVRPRPSPPNSRAIPSLRWVNALKIVERTSGSIQCRCLKSRPKSGSFRFERLHGFAAFLGEFGGVFQQIPQDLLNSHIVADHNMFGSNPAP
jgi:hypothetical protein